MIDKAAFPRDKACGDVVGPRAVGLLSQMGVPVPESLPVGDILVSGPSGRFVRMYCLAGVDYPPHGLVSRRIDFDAALRDSATGRGAEPLEGQVVSIEEDRNVTTVVTTEGLRIEAGAVIGADGATSRVAETQGLVDRSKVQWGFAVRTYLEVDIALPTIVLFEQSPWSAVTGYGWVFPSAGGGCNAGVGIGTLSERKGADAVKLLQPFLDHVTRLGLFYDEVRGPGRVLGGWLKMGMVGTVPGRGTTLLVGDAAGLVNPLQGEGIAQALASGRAAARSILEHPGDPSAPYRAELARTHLPYHRIASVLQQVMVSHPKAISAVGRVLTAPGIGRALAQPWGLYWNELLEGAPRTLARSMAVIAESVGRAATTRTTTNKWFEEVYGPGSQVSGGPDQPPGGSLAGNDSSPHSSTSSNSSDSGSETGPSLFSAP
jgi:flavin-dependent dehydrogenase